MLQLFLVLFVLFQFSPSEGTTFLARTDRNTVSSDFHRIEMRIIFRMLMIYLCAQELLRA